MRTPKKRVLLLLLVLAVALVFAACSSGGNEDAAKVTGTVVITADTEILNVEVSVPEDQATADQAFIQACKDNNVTYTYENGMFDNFGGKASTQTDGWLFYTNGELADVGAKDVKLTEGFKVEFKYENYDEAFNL